MWIQKSRVFPKMWIRKCGWQDCGSVSENVVGKKLEIGDLEINGIGDRIFGDRRNRRSEIWRSTELEIGDLEIDGIRDRRFGDRRNWRSEIWRSTESEIGDLEIDGIGDRRFGDRRN